MPIAKAKKGAFDKEEESMRNIHTVKQAMLKGE